MEEFNPSLSDPMDGDDEIKPLVETMAELIEIGKIRIDGGTQPRQFMNHVHTDALVDALELGAKTPPVVVFFDKQGNYWLADGYHRLDAALRRGFQEIEANIVRGSQRDAILHSLGANADHGLPRSNADKRRAVTTMMQDSTWSGWSDRKIAEICRVSNRFVSELRKQLPPVTVNVHSEKPKSDPPVTVNVHSEKPKSDPPVTVNVHSEKPKTTPAPSKQLRFDGGHEPYNPPKFRTYVDKHGNESKMDVSRIGKKQTPVNAPTAAEPQPEPRPKTSVAGDAVFAKRGHELKGAIEQLDSWVERINEICLEFHGPRDLAEAFGIKIVDDVEASLKSTLTWVEELAEAFAYEEVIRS